jgi:hypothetical protein
MSAVLRRNRKTSDEDVTRLNALGLSLLAIADMLKCHPTSVTLRLKRLGVPQTDTRRSFMDDIFRALPDSHREVILKMFKSESGPRNIKDYVVYLIDKDVSERQGVKPEPTKQLELVFMKESSDE